MAILSKKIKNLTDEDLKELAKPLGVKGRPYPMRDTVFDTDARGEKTLINRLGSLENNRKPLLVFSDRDYGDVLGMAMREMPTPGMLPMFFDAIVRRNPNNTRRVQFMKGAAGAGKTYMSEMVGRMRDDRGAMVIDCANLNMAELLYETVLDFNAGRTFYDELDKKLTSGKINPLSIKILRENLGEAFSEENGKITIDWSMVGHNLKDTEGEKVDSNEAVTQALAALRKVSQLEGMDTQGGNALGMATQEGPLIRAYKDGREIILDEFNRCKKGTTGVLHGVLQLMIGEKSEHTVHNSLKEKGDDGGQSFTFKREDMRAGFFVTLTGNTEMDGSDVEELPQSLNSRIIPQHVPVATQEDWQHRICQILTGIPVSTIYRSAEDQWSKDPDGFRKQLVAWRELNETREVPEIQLRLLRRWEDVLEASEKLAKFYYGWSQIVNPDSLVHRSGSLAQLLEELDDTYNKEVTIDFRKIIAHIAEAMEDRPDVRAPEQTEGYDLGANLNQKPDLTEEMLDSEDPAVAFGSRLSAVIVKQIVADTAERGKYGLYNQLMRHAADCGLVDAQLHEGMKSSARSVAELLNDNPFDSQIQDVKAELIRDLICDHLRDSYKDISKDNNDIMSIANVRRALDTVEHETANNKNADVVPPAVIFNEDPDDIHREPFSAVRTIDIAEGHKDPAVSELVAQNALLTTFASPGLRHRNLRAIWNQALSKSVDQSNGVKKLKDQSLAIAENTSEKNIAVTTVMVAGGKKGAEKAVPLHVLWNKSQDQLVVIGEGKIGESLRQAFNKSRTIYVDRLENEAAKKASSAISSYIGSESREVGSLIKDAFLNRIMLPTTEDEKSKTLSELLVSKDVEVYVPHFVARKTKSGPAAPSA